MRPVVANPRRSANPASDCLEELGNRMRGVRVGLQSRLITIVVTNNAIMFSIVLLLYERRTEEQLAGVD